MKVGYSNFKCDPFFASYIIPILIIDLISWRGENLSIWASGFRHLTACMLSFCENEEDLKMRSTDVLIRCQLVRRVCLRLKLELKFEFTNFEFRTQDWCDCSLSTKSLGIEWNIWFFSIFFSLGDSKHLHLIQHKLIIISARENSLCISDCYVMLQHAW